MPGRARVEQRGRLVEHERVRVEQHQPGQRDLLGLRRGERRTAGADLGVEPVGQRLHPAPRRRPPAARARARPSSASTWASRRLSASDPTNTWCSWVTSATCPRSSSSGRSISGTPPTVTVPPVGRVDAGEHPAERRLARAGRPDDGQPLAGGAGRGRSRAARRGPRGTRTRRPRAAMSSSPGVARPRLAVRLDQLHADDARERRGRHLDLVDPEDQLPHRTGDLVRVQHDRRHRADRDVPSDAR